MPFAKSAKATPTNFGALPGALAGNMRNPTELFSKYESALTDVAKELGLSIEKYRHDMANWSFSCPHPKGGNVRIDIQINEYGDVFLLKWWFFEFNQQRGWIYKSENAWELDQSVWIVVAAIRRAFAQIS